MARDTEGKPPEDPQVRERDTAKLLDRRSYLKAAGGALAASGFLSTTAQNTAAQATTIDINDGDAIDPHLERLNDGDSISIPNGTYEFNGATISADNWTVIGNGATFDAQGDTYFSPEGTGWTFGGVEFNVQSGNVRCLPKGRGWTLKNLAWNGPSTQGTPLVRPYVYSDGEAHIENIWFGDGMGTRVGESALKANSDGNGNYSVEGDLYVKGCYFYQNACYVAASAGPGQPGRVHFDSCYFEDAYLAAIRTGSLNGTCNVKNCVINLVDASNIPETSGGGSNSRGVWAYWGEVVVENCEIYTPNHSALLVSSSKANAHITARDCEVVGHIGSGVSTSNIGNNPSRSPPSSCVTSAQEAATGQGSSEGTDTSTDEFPNTISVSGGSSSNSLNYEFTVTEQARKSTARGATIDDEDTISDKTVSGAIAGGTDSYEFAGQISSFSIDGDATIYLNGSETTANQLANATTTTDDSSSNTGSDSGSSSTQYDGTLIIDGTGHPRLATTYTFNVSGEVKKSSELGSINAFDTIENGVIKGRVINGKDAFKLSGEIVGFKIDGKADITYKDGN